MVNPMVWRSNGDLFLLGELCAALGSGEHFVRIAAVVWIKYGSKFLHRLEIVLGKLLLHEVDFLGADPVFAGHTSAQLDAFRQDLVAGQQGSFDLIRIALVEEDQWMDVSITGVEHVWDS